MKRRLAAPADNHCGRPRQRFATLPAILHLVVDKPFLSVFGLISQLLGFFSQVLNQSARNRCPQPCKKHIDLPSERYRSLDLPRRSFAGRVHEIQLTSVQPFSPRSSDCFRNTDSPGHAGCLLEPRVPQPFAIVRDGAAAHMKETFFELV